jgi:hypothetical protein
VQINKALTLVLMLKPRIRSNGFDAKPLITIATDFEAKPKKPVLLVSYTCMMQIAHGVIRPPDRQTTEYPTCV